MTFDFGMHVVRLLGDLKGVYCHFASNAMMQCLGDDCPICKNNKKLYIEHGRNARSVSGFVSKQYRHYGNVLDRTPVKVCASCQAENKRGISGQFNPTCVKCGTFITSVESKPSNVVKVINLSDTNAKMLATIQNSILDINGNPLGLNSYDLQFMVVKTDKKTILPSALPANNDVVTVEDELLFDLNTIPLRLEVDEILNLLRGISLRDIFAARRSQTTPVSEPNLPSIAEPDIEREVQEAFESVFGKA
jgi:hypothetical protein